MFWNHSPLLLSFRYLTDCDDYKEAIRWLQGGEGTGVRRDSSEAFADLNSLSISLLSTLIEKNNALEERINKYEDIIRNRAETIAFF